MYGVRLESACIEGASMQRTRIEGAYIKGA